MKKLLYFTLLIVIIAASSFVIYNKRETYSSLYSALDPCKNPIKFKVNDVDSRFKLSRQQVIEYSKEAAQIWNEGSNLNLFVYSEDGDLSINMVYDSRQQTSNKINELDKDVGEEKDKLEEMVAKHKADVAAFKQRLANHNEKVQQWNSQGGAPPDEYQKLIEEQRSLEAEANALNDQAENLNIATEDYNVQVGQLNEVISDFNEDLEKRPEEGLYIGEENKIEIYFNNNKNELIHTLAHELGHARGVDHNNDSDSIMYPFSTRTIELTEADLTDLAEVCRPKSPTEVIRTRLNF